MTRDEGRGTREEENGLFIKRPTLGGRSFSRTPPPASRLALFFMVMAFALAGCSHVKPWEKEILSRPGMQLDPLPMVSGCDDHIYFSREASKGGRSYSGGGCGCN